MTSPLLSVEDLEVVFATRSEELRAVDRISFQIAPGEILGVVGESGSGKTIAGQAIMRLIDSPAARISGAIRFGGRDLLRLGESELREIRGNRIATVFQDPMMTLNPVMRVGAQIVEAVRAHRAISARAARDLAIDALRRVGIPAPEKRIDSYPHEMSGGMRQRVAIAIAIINEPELIIADEPTTALDVTIQSQIIYQMRKLCREAGMAMIWISHDLSVVARLADRLCVMYAGRIVDAGPTAELLARAAHPYTRGLMASIPSGTEPGLRLPQIPGMMHRPEPGDCGCRFRSRCSEMAPDCENPPPEVRLPGDHVLYCHHPCPPLPREARAR